MKGIPLGVAVRVLAWFCRVFFVGIRLYKGLFFSVFCSRALSFWVFLTSQVFVAASFVGSRKVPLRVRCLQGISGGSSV